MLASLFGNLGSNFASVIEKHTAIDDPQVIPHVANMLAALKRQSVQRTSCICRIW